MSSKPITIRVWSCDSCGNTDKASDNSRELLPGWTMATAEIPSATGGHQQGLDLCPTCSKDPQTAIENYKENLRTSPAIGRRINKAPYT